MNRESVMQGMFLQNKRMHYMFQAYPEVLMVDATYKLNDLRLPLFVLLVIDGNGESEVCGLFLVTDEGRETLQKMFSFFKKHNPSWEQIKCIMSDKDFTERSILLEEMPQASLQICLYHTLRTFRREITTEKMGITQDQRNLCLELLQRMAYSKSKKEYDLLYLQLQHVFPKNVRQYFEEQWHTIKEEWVQCFKNEKENYLNSTNNRLESINQKFKAVVQRYSSITEFFNRLQKCLDSLSDERDQRATNLVQKRPVSYESMSIEEKEYLQHLTPYAFGYVKQQLSLKTKVKEFENQGNGSFTVNSTQGMISTSSTNCECCFHTAMKLPCRHIFALRLQLGQPLFCPALCNPRWGRNYYQENHLVFAQVSETIETTEMDQGIVTVGDVKPKRILSQHEKYRKAFDVAKQLASICSEVTTREYPSYLGVLEDLLEHWRMGQRVSLKQYDDKIDECNETDENDESLQHMKEVKEMPRSENEWKGLVPGRKFSPVID